MTSMAPQQYRWAPEGFVRAYEAGAFDGRVELINGEVWPVIIGNWHGATVGRVFGHLFQLKGGEPDGSTLPAGDSLPDPDCWVRRRGAQPKTTVSNRLATWDPADVLLVVEVSDDSVLADLNTKADLYGSTGYGVYWVITPEVIYEHTEPIDGGYRVRTEYRRGDRIPVGYADTELAVDDLLGERDS